MYVSESESAREGGKRRMREISRLDWTNARAAAVGGFGFSAWFSFVILHTSSTSLSRQHAQVSDFFERECVFAMRASSPRNTSNNFPTCHIIIFHPLQPTSFLPFEMENPQILAVGRRRRENVKKIVNMRWLCDFLRSKTLKSSLGFARPRERERDWKRKVVGNSMTTMMMILKALVNVPGGNYRLFSLYTKCV